MIGFSQCADHPSCRWQGTGVQAGGDGAMERKGSSRSAVAVVDRSLEEREPPGRSNPQEEVKDRSRKGSWGPGKQGEFPGFRSADPRTQRGGLGPHLPVVAAGTEASREPRSHLCTLTLSPRPRRAHGPGEGGFGSVPSTSLHCPFSSKSKAFSFAAYS